MSKTGMFVPKGLEKTLTPSSTFGKLFFAVGFAAAVVGTAFLLRMYTISRLTIWTKAQNVTAVAILPDDAFMMDHRMSDILALKEVKEQMQGNKQYLVYFIPQYYIMQGMIADTGGDWKLFNQHHSLAMITDWIFNPFGHLRKGHHAMYNSMHMQHENEGIVETSTVRRLIFISIENVPVKNPSDLFSIDALRVPQFMTDVDVHALRLLDVKELPHGSGWGSVPTPVF
jgi:hypothetical protein